MQGYLYVVTGDKYVREAAESARSLKKVDSGAHITLISDQHHNYPVFDEVKILGERKEGEAGWKGGMLFRIRGMMETPYEDTFFVDSDTYFAENCRELFGVLQYHDLLISHAVDDSTEVEIDGKKLPGYYAYNCGVIVYKKNERIDALLDKWLEIYKEKFDVYPHDQAPFMEALLTCDVKIHVLQPIYNLRLPSVTSLPALKVKILHGRMEYVTPITKDFASLAALLNERLVLRAYLPRKGVTYLKDPPSLAIGRKLPPWLVQGVRTFKQQLGYGSKSK